ncbi:MAG: helix-turn-helix domain-containing protein, partial [Oscillospiraceae bacterium]
WRIVMYEVILDSCSLPVLCGCDVLAAAEPFRHIDRTAEFNVMIYVTSGTIYVTEDKTDYAVNAGELLFLKAGVRHFGKYEIPKGTSWFFAHFLTNAGEYPPFAQESTPSPYSPLQCSISLPKYLTGLSGSEFERELLRFADYARSDDKLKRWYMNARFFELLSGLALAPEARKRESLSDRICGFLAAHRDEPFSTAAVSAEFYLSYKYLAAVFKREKGVTMQQYHTALRMDEACRLLRSTLFPVGEIAAALGYSDMLYFSRTFREKVGCAPTEYRRRPQVY